MFSSSRGIWIGAIVAVLLVLLVATYFVGPFGPEPQPTEPTAAAESAPPLNPNPEAATFVLEGGVECHFNGTANLMELDGRALTYNCLATEGGQATTLLDAPAMDEDGTVRIDYATLSGEGDEIALAEITPLAFVPAQIDLVDSTACRRAEEGGAAEGAPSYICEGEPATALVGVLSYQNDGIVTAVRGAYQEQPGGGTVEETAEVGVQAIHVEAAE